MKLFEAILVVYLVIVPVSGNCDESLVRPPTCQPWERNWKGDGRCADGSGQPISNVKVGEVVQGVSTATLEQRLFDLVRKSGGCQTDEVGFVKCDFRIGRDLQIHIAFPSHAGQLVSFYKSSIDGDYYGSLNKKGCVVIYPGKGNKQFKLDSLSVSISPKDGRVYQSQDWEACSDE